jgi:Glycosyl transferase family 2
MSAQTGRRTEPGSEVEAHRELQRLESTLERDRRRIRARMKEVREGLDSLNAMLDGVESTSLERANERTRLRARMQRLARERERNRELVEARLDEIRGQLDRIAPASDVASIGEQVAAIQKAIRETDEERRRRLARSAAIVLMPLALLRRRSAAPKRGGPAREQKRPSRSRRVMNSVRRRSRRIIRVPRRILRRTRAWIRSKLFSRGLGNLNHHPPIPLRIPRRYRREIELTNPPVISIVTPTFNTGSFLERTMLSVLDQNYPRIEYIVQDGGSTDETEEVLKRHADRLQHVEMRPDDGHAHAINLGFEHATGSVMAFLNADDILLPGSLHYVGCYFERHPEVDLVYGHRVLVDENDMEIGRWVMPRHDDEVLRWADFVPQETMFWRRRLWERSGGYMDQRWPFSLDWELLVRFMEAGARTVRLPRFLGGFRVHEAQKTSAIIDTQGGQEMAALRRRIHGREVTREEVRAGVRPYMRRHVLLHRVYRAHLVRY